MVLVADDDPDFASSIEPILQRNGYVVEIARNGGVALEKASAPGLNCIILDLRMPLLSGLEVYLKLKETGAAVPTIFVTGFVDDNHHESLRRINGFGLELLIKPFNPAHLLQAVEAAMLPRRAADVHAG